MKRLSLILSLLFVPVFLFASPPDVGFTIDLAHPTVRFEYTTHEGNTPCIPVSVLTNGLPYNGFAGYSCELNYMVNDSASALKTVSGTISGNIATFQALTNSFPASGDFFCEIYFSTAYGASKITAGQGILHVSRSPSSNAHGSLNLVPRINFDTLSFIGTPPWTLLTEPVFLASVSYNISSAMTNNWTTSYLDELLLRTQFNSTSGQVTTALGTLTTNLANEIARATNAETIISNAYIAAIAGETSRATNAETTISNTFHVAFTNQANTNANFESRISSNETFRITTQPATNAVLQGEINALTISASNAVFRYFADTASNVMVLANGQGITESLGGTTHTFVVPSGIRLFSSRIRWDGGLGSTFKIVFVETGINSDAATRWPANFQAYREDTGAPIPGASCRPDDFSNFDTENVYGLSTATINICLFNY